MTSAEDFPLTALDHRRGGNSQADGNINDRSINLTAGDKQLTPWHTSPPQGASATQIT